MTSSAPSRTSPHFEDVPVGAELPSLVKRPNEVQLFFFSAATWDAHRTHWDIPYSVEKEKLPGILIHGHLQGSWLGQLMTDWIGPQGWLRRVSYQNRGNAIPGDTLTIKGKVKEKREEGGKGIVVCDVWVENQRGEQTTVGEAIAELPRKR